MTQTLLFVVLHCIGTALCLALGPRRRTALSCALGFSIGLAVMVAVVLLLCAAGIPYTKMTTIAIAALVVGACAWRIARRGIGRDELRIVGIWTVAFTAASLLLTFPNVSFLTYDSHMLVIFGGAVFDDHGFAPGMIRQLSDWGVFQTIAQSDVGFTRETYLYSLALVLGASTIPVFVLTLGAALDALQANGRRRALLIALVTVVTFSTYMLMRHFFYLHTNLGSAVYLFEFIALWWLAEIERELLWLALAFIAMLALALQRIEHPLICAFFLSMTILRSGLAPYRVLAPLGLYSLAITAWCGVLAANAASDSEFLTPTKCIASAAVVVAFFGYAWLSLVVRLRFIERLNAWLPALAALVVGVGLVFAFATKTEHMMISLEPWYENLWHSDAWAGVWPLIIAIAVAGWFTPAPPHRAAFVWGIPIYFVLIVLLAYGRTPYRISNGDSGTRMAMHLIPITMFYFGIKFIPLFYSRDLPGTPAPEG
jgi:hypothetical protein